MKSKIQEILQKIQTIKHEKDLPARDKALDEAFAELGQVVTPEVSRTVPQGTKTIRQFIHNGSEIDLVVTVITDGESFMVNAVLDDA